MRQQTLDICYFGTVVGYPSGSGSFFIAPILRRVFGSNAVKFWFRLFLSILGLLKADILIIMTTFIAGNDI